MVTRVGTKPRRGVLGNLVLVDRSGLARVDGTILVVTPYPGCHGRCGEAHHHHDGRSRKDHLLHPVHLLLRHFYLLHPAVTLRRMAECRVNRNQKWNTLAVKFVTLEDKEEVLS